MDAVRLNRLIKHLNNELYKEFPLKDDFSNYYGSPVGRNITVYTSLSNILMDALARDVLRDV